MKGRMEMRRILAGFMALVLLAGSISFAALAEEVSAEASAVEVSPAPIETEVPADVVEAVPIEAPSAESTPSCDFPEETAPTIVSSPEPAPSADAPEAPAETLPPETLSLAVGASMTLVPEFFPSPESQEIEWQSSAPEIVSVENGILTALSTGEALITADCGNAATEYLVQAYAPSPETNSDLAPEPDTSQICLNTAAVKLGVKEKFGLTAEADSEAEISFASENSKIASVDKDGVITGKKAGETKIIVSCGALTAECSITVVKAPSKVTLSASKLSLGAGQTAVLTAELNNGNENKVTFSSSKASVASVDENGLITAHARGTAKITATAYNGKKASSTVTVLAAPETLQLNKYAVTLPAGMTFELEPGVNKGAAAGFSFASSDESIAAVDVDGRISALNPGTAEIAVTAYNGLTAACSVTIVPAPTEIRLDAEELQLGVKESFRLLPVNDQGCEADYTYSSSNAKVASVNESGLITAKKPGNATITVTSYNGLTASCEIIVGKAPSKLTLSEKTLKLGAGQSIRLSAALNNGAVGSISFSSGKPEIASVDASGLITAVSEGKTTITVRTYNGKKASCSISVLPAPTDLSLAESSASLPMGMTLALKPIVDEGAMAGFSFSSSDEAVAVVDAEGVITAIAAGTAEIHVRTHNGLQATCAINVTPAPTKITLDTYALELGLMESRQLVAYVDQGENAGLRYASGNEKIASIDENGLIHAKKTGETTVTVTSFNGISAVCTVRIMKAPTRIMLSETSLELESGDIHQLTARLNEGAAGRVSYSSDSGCVSVDENGCITALSEGIANITVETYNGKTAVCTVTVTWSPDAFFEYDFVNGSCTITKYIGSDAHVRIPSEIDGSPVSAIGPEAFAGSGILESVDLPETLETIGARAFANCPRLRSVS